MRGISFLAFVFCGLLTGNILFAQQSQHYLKRYSVEEGLAHTTAGRMIEDKFGFVWICTEDGLSRFDGYGFRNYNHKQGDPNSLPANWCGELFLDADKNLWVITSSNKISMYNPKEDNFNNYSPGKSHYYRNIRHEKKENKLVYLSETTAFLFHFETKKFELIYTDTSINYLDAQIIGENLLMLTSKGFFECNLKTKKTSRILTGLKELDDPVVPIFYPMLKPDPRGDIYIPALKGLFRFNYKSGTAEYITSILTANAGRVEFNSYTGAFFEDDETLWISTSINGALKVDLSGKNLPVSYNNSDAVNLRYAINSNEVYNIFKSSSGEIIILTYNGINVYDNVLGRFRFHAFNDDLKKGKTTEKYHFFIEDRQKNYFFSTTLDGIKVMERKKKFNDLVWLYDRFIKDIVMTKGVYDKNIRILKENLNDIAIRDLLEDKSGDLWICVDFGVVHISQKDGKVSLITENSSPVKLFSEQPGDIIEHPDGSLWVLPFNGQITKIIPDLNTSVKIDLQYLSDHQNLHAYSGYFDNSGVLWLGFTEGIMTYHPVTEKFTNFFTDPVLGKQSARFWLEPDPNTLIIGGTERLIFKDLKTGKMSVIKFFYNGEEAEKEFPIMAGLIKDGILWIGTYGGGVVKYDLKTGEQKNFRKNEGLSNEYILEILDDNTGNLWLSTNRGINKLNIASENIESYHAHDNTVSEEFNAGGALYLKNGVMIFGGTKGLTAFYPGEITSNTLIPEVRFTGYVIHTENNPYNRVIPAQNPVVLNYGDNLVSFSFTALNFINSDQNQYAYKLEGFDDQWIMNGNRREVFFSNLDPGEYTLKIAASNNDVVWNRAGASVKIIVNPPWWGTWWFRIILIISVTVFLWFLYNERIKSIRKIEQTRADERLRTLRLLDEARIAEDKKREELEQNLKAEIARDLHDDVISELSVITNKCSQILSDNRLGEKNQGHLNVIKDVSESVKVMIRDVIWFLQNENETNERMISKFYSTAGNMLQEKDYDPEIQPDVFDHPAITVYAKKQIYLIFKESIENIAKHSDAASVMISLTREKDLLKMILRDNGKGFDPGNHKQGNGILNMKKRAAHLHAKLTVDSAPGKGTLTTLELNLSDKIKS